MPQVNGLFTHLSNLSQLSADKVMVWLPKTFDARLVENYLGNRLLYPSSVPTSAREELIDLAILREALKLSPKSYYDPNLSRIYFPQDLLLYFSDLTKLAWAFIDVFVVNPITTVITRGNVIKNAGTILKPKIIRPKGTITIWIKNQNRKYSVKIGSLTLIPVNLPKVDIKFESFDATLSGQSAMDIEVAGGILGLIIDTRI